MKQTQSELNLKATAKLDAEIQEELNIPDPVNKAEAKRVLEEHKGDTEGDDT